MSEHLTLNLSYRRLSDASMVSLDSASSAISPAGPLTPANSFGAFSSKSLSSHHHAMTPNSTNIMANSSPFSYSHDLMNHSWQFSPGTHDRAATRDSPLDSLKAEEYCSLGPEDAFQYSTFSTQPGSVIDFVPSLTSSTNMSELVDHGLHPFSPGWSPESSETHSTVSPSETFHIPDVASVQLGAFDQVNWDFTSEPIAHMSSYQNLCLQTPPPSPHRPMVTRRELRGRHGEVLHHSRPVRSGRVQKSSPRETEHVTRVPCNEVISTWDADGTRRPILGADGKPQICTKTFRRAEHLTRHKKTLGHSQAASLVFCPVKECKKSRQSEKSSSFGGGRRDNLNDHFRKTHCVQSEKRGRNDRISRREAEEYGSEWLQLWDDAQPDAHLRELKKIWNPHDYCEQDPHRVIDFFLANNLRLPAAQLKKTLKHAALEARILKLLPPRDDQRPSKIAKCKSRPRSSGVRS